MKIHQKNYGASSLVAPSDGKVWGIKPFDGAISDFVSF